MAIYHLKVSVGNRLGGQSAAAKYDYIGREGHYATHDAEELEYRESGNMPAWAEEDPGQYWQAADENERANGVLFRQVQFALPNELKEGERRELAHSFAEKLTEQERLPYTLAIHKGEARNPEDNNPHAHLVISERINDGQERSAETWFKRANKKAPEKGGALKSRALQGRDWLEQTRQEWATTANRALDRAGRKERIDPRSLAERFIEAKRESEAAEKDPTKSQAERDRLLERAAELSREPDVKLPPALAVQAAAEAVVGKEQIHSENPLIRRAAEVEQRNAAQIEERDGPIQRIKTRIGEIQQQLKHLPDHIMAAAERAAEWGRAQRRTWLKKHGYESEIDYKYAMLAEKFSHANGPQISERPSAQARAENERQQREDRGRSR